MIKLREAEKSEIRNERQIKKLNKGLRILSKITSVDEGTLDFRKLHQFFKGMKEAKIIV